ncbi:MAG: hypothetical protein IPN69_00025 [Acidobacteria bacterium]|nr:hypothetical protein [Acidobacteriota bacterium]
MIVQYQQQEFARLNLTPYPAKMESNIRTVDETAPVKMLQPMNPVLSYPNKITDRDFDNWVQERNLYIFDGVGRQIPRRCSKPTTRAEKESLGGMLYAEIGKGRYVYVVFVVPPIAGRQSRRISHFRESAEPAESGQEIERAQSPVCLGACSQERVR